MHHDGLARRALATGHGDAPAHAAAAQRHVRDGAHGDHLWHPRRPVAQPVEEDLERFEVVIPGPGKVEAAGDDVLARKPGDTAIARARLRARRPPYVSRTNASATCATMKPARRRCADRPGVLPRPTCSAAASRARPCTIAGAASTNPASSAPSSPASATRPSRATRPPRGRRSAASVASRRSPDRRHDEPQQGAGGRDDEGLGERVPHQLGAASAERAADGGLVGPGGRAYEEQVDEVHGAEDEQQERAALQQPQRRLHRRDVIAVEGRDDRVVSGLRDHLGLRKPVRARRIQRIHLRLGLGQRGAG